jgi:hypothetical protein
MAHARCTRPVFMSCPDRRPAYNSPGGAIGMRLVTTCPKPLFWILAAVLAVQPAAVGPACACCKAPNGNPSQAALRRHCCQSDGSIAANPAKSASRPAVPGYTRTLGCCCTGAPVCLCNAGRLPARRPFVATPSLRVVPDELLAPLATVPGMPAGILIGVLPNWGLDSLPACASAPQRCSSLCRWLF